jgi:predicted transcriptional regulator
LSARVAAAELFATNAEPDDGALDAALERGLKDVEAGLVHPVEEVKAMIPRWTQSPDCGQRHCWKR